MFALPFYCIVYICTRTYVRDACSSGNAKLADKTGTEAALTVQKWKKINMN